MLRAFRKRRSVSLALLWHVLGLHQHAYTLVLQACALMVLYATFTGFCTEANKLARAGESSASRTRPAS